jgi:hypothetical protein
MDLLQISAVVLLFLFVLSLVAGSYSGLLALGVLAAVLAVFVGVVYLFYVGFSPAVAAAVVAAGAALVVLTRRSSAGEEDDVTMEKECIKLEDGLKILPPDARDAITKVLKKPASYHKLCFHIYKGKGVPGGKDIVMTLFLFATPPEIAIRICKMLSKSGYPCAVETDVVRHVYFKFKEDIENRKPKTSPPDLPMQHI